MATETTPEVRLVRCPKCQMLLPEMADFPVYKCGECDTILLAKNRKAVVKTTSLSREEAAHADRLVNMSEHGESSSSTPQEVLLSPPEYPLSQERGYRTICSDSQSEKHNENLSIEGQRADQNPSSDSDSNCDMLDENRLNEGLQNGSGQLPLKSLEYCSVQQPGVSIEGFLSTELHPENEELMLVEEANLEVEANERMSQFEDANSESETDNKIESKIRGLSIECPPPTREINNLTVCSCAAAGEPILPDTLFCAPNEHLEQPQRSEHQGLDRVSSSDTFETAETVSVSSELSSPRVYLPKSTTTTRSSHASDGSISSYDGADDHFPDQPIHSSKNEAAAASSLVPEESHRRDKLPSKGLMNGKSGMQDHARNLSSDLPNKKHYAKAKYSKWHRDEALEPVMHHCPPRNWARLEKDAYPSRVPFFQKSSLLGYGSAGPSREFHDDSPFDSAFHPPEKAVYSERGNMKLLRMVRELQDQLSKTRHLNGKHNGRTSTDLTWKQKHFPSYYDREPPEEENFYPTYHGRHGHRSSWSQQSRFSHIPFSGGAISTRHEIDDSCSCCHPQAWQRSEQLPPPVFQHNRGFCSTPCGHSRFNSYSSCPSSPQRYLESDFSVWSHETKSDDQNYRDHELKRYVREKHHSDRRRLRPKAGGAPFVTCYHCLRTLQLPADFLLFKRRFHQLRCGACSKVLEFALQKGIHIVPYELVAAEPEPREVDECSDAINARIIKSASCSQGCLQGDASYSDDHGRSGQSCSTDGDPVSQAQFHNLQGNADVKNLSCSSSKPMEQREDFVSKMSEIEHKNSMETFDSAGPALNLWSEKVSSEIEELPPTPRTGGRSFINSLAFHH